MAQGPESAGGWPGQSPQAPEPGEGGQAPSAHFLNPRTLTPHVVPASASESAQECNRALQELPNQASNWSAGLLAWLGLPNILLEDVPDVPPEYYSCPFKVSKLSR